ncbi:MAG: hypothetical protein ACO3R4_00905, partial [Litorivicinaceae bacterium]
LVFCSRKTHNGLVAGWLSRQRALLLAPYQDKTLCQELTITPLPITHSKMTSGYILKGRREAVVYFSDCDGIGP